MIPYNSGDPRFDDTELYDDEVIVLSTLGAGPVGPEGPSATQDQVYQATSDFITAHPEYVTTIEDRAVTTGKIADSAVTTDKIAYEAITYNKIANGAVGPDKIPNGSIDTDKIAYHAITNDNIGQDAVTRYNLADNSVGSMEIIDDAIHAQHLAADVVDGLPDMSTSQRGVAKVGAGLAMNNGVLELDGDGDIATAVQSWLDAHSEATTTVEDGAVTDAKLVQIGGVLSEVHDIRTGVGGTIYANAGKAVRSQVESLQDISMGIVTPTSNVSTIHIQSLDLSIIDAPVIKVSRILGDTIVKVCGTNYFDMSDYLDFNEYAQSPSYRCKPIYLRPNTSYVVKAIVVDSSELAAIDAAVVIDEQAFRYTGGIHSVQLNKMSTDTTKTLTTGESGCLYLNMLTYALDKQYNLDHMAAGCKIMISAVASKYVDYDGITIDSDSTVVIKGKDKLFANTIRTAATMSDAETAKVNVSYLVSDYEAIANRVQPYLSNNAMVIRPLLVELCADFNWVSFNEVSAFGSNNEKFTTEDGANNAYFKVTGNKGDNYVTVVAGGNAEISDLGSNTGWWGAVIGWGDGTYTACNARYRDSETLEVYPPLKQAIIDGELGNIRTGIHLSKRGYIAYAQAAFAANPKWCEKGSYLAKWDYNDGLSPLVKFGGAAYLGLSALNLGSNFMSHYLTTRANLSFATSYTPHETRTGLTWDVELDDTKSGYLELFVGGLNDAYIDYPEGQEFIVEVYLDNQLTYTRTKTNQICERMCFDYANARTGRVRIYSDKWAAVDGYYYGISVSRMTWWVNEVEHETTLIPKFKTIAQMFDSWGVFHQQASAKELHRLQSEQSSVTTRYENHSLGSQTSAWGKAWFYENVEKYRPQIMLVNFLINDSNSTSTTGWPETVAGPDGTLYDNILTADEYVANMNDLFNMAIANGIQPIMLGYALQGPLYVNMWMSLIDNV